MEKLRQALDLLQESAQLVDGLNRDEVGDDIEQLQLLVGNAIKTANDLVGKAMLTTDSHNSRSFVSQNSILLDQHSKHAVEFVVRAFEDSTFSDDYQKQNFVFDKFCDGFSNDPDEPDVPKLNLDAFGNDADEEGQFWADIWQDHLNLVKHVTRYVTSIDMLIEFEKLGFVQFSRNEALKFPDFALHDSNLDFDNAKRVLYHFEKLGEHTKRLESYFLMWNAFLSLFSEFDQSYRDKDDVDNADGLSGLLKHDLAQNIAKMGSVGFGQDCQLRNPKQTFQDKDVEYILPLFNNNLAAINWLTEKIELNIPHWKRFFEEISDDELDCGLRYYVSHYFTIYLFSIFETPDSPMECPFKEDLRKFFDLVWQFAIYNVCYPRQVDMKSAKIGKQENFYLKQFAKYAINKDIDKTNNSLRQRLVHPNLYSIAFFESGTLLHGATAARMLRYCKKLVFHGFDIEAKPFEVSGSESAWDLSIRIPSRIYEYYYSILLRSESYDPPSKIEDGYFGLKKQTQFAKLFCHYLGCFGKEDLPPFSTTNGGPHGPLHFEYNKCQKIERVTSNPRKAMVVMTLLSEVCVQLIQDQQPLSDDLLVLCYDYCKDYDAPQAKRIKESLEKAIDMCLHQNIDLRSKEWFKQYILNSNVLFLSAHIRNEDDKLRHAAAAKLSGMHGMHAMSGMEVSMDPAAARLEAELAKAALEATEAAAGTTSNSDSVLRNFTEVSQKRVADELLYGKFIKEMNDRNEEQRVFIQKQCQNEEKKGAMYWNELLKFEFKDISGMQDGFDLRQDCIEQIKGIKEKAPKIKSIVPEIDAMTLSTMECNIFTESDKFGYFEEANISRYLGKCLVIAHSLNAQFHETMIQIVDIFNKGGVRNRPRATYRAAPVKKRDRCVNRCYQKWHFKVFPSAANITDFVRGSIKFRTPEDMIEGIHEFVNFVKNGNQNGQECCIIDIVGFKNHFKKNILEEKEYKYSDVEFNVVVYDKQANLAMIAEIRFILEWMLDAKKMCHIFKFIKNQMNYVTKVYDRILWGQKYFRKTIEHLMTERDYDSLVKYMLFFENRLLAMFNYNRPLLYDCIKHKFFKGFYFFMDSIQHFSKLLGTFNHVQDTKAIAAPSNNNNDNDTDTNNNNVNNINNMDLDFKTLYFCCKANKTMDPKKGIFWGLDIGTEKQLTREETDVFFTILGFDQNPNSNMYNDDWEDSDTVFFSKVLNYQVPVQSNNTTLMTLLMKGTVNEIFIETILSIPGIDMYLKNANNQNVFEMIDAKIKGAKKRRGKKPWQGMLKKLSEYEKVKEELEDKGLSEIKDQMKTKHQTETSWINSHMNDSTSTNASDVSTLRHQKDKKSQASQPHLSHLSQDYSVHTKDSYVPSERFSEDFDYSLTSPTRKPLNYEKLRRFESSVFLLRMKSHANQEEQQNRDTIDENHETNENETETELEDNESDVENENETDANEDENERNKKNVMGLDEDQNENERSDAKNSKNKGKGKRKGKHRKENSEEKEEVEDTDENIIDFDDDEYFKQPKVESIFGKEENSSEENTNVLLRMLSRSDVSDVLKQLNFEAVGEKFVSDILSQVGLLTGRIRYLQGQMQRLESVASSNLVSNDEIDKLKQQLRLAYESINTNEDCNELMHEQEQKLNEQNEIINKMTLELSQLKIDNANESNEMKEMKEMNGEGESGGENVVELEGKIEYLETHLQAAREVIEISPDCRERMDEHEEKVKEKFAEIDQKLNVKEVQMIEIENKLNQLKEMRMRNSNNSNRSQSEEINALRQEILTLQDVLKESEQTNEKQKQQYNMVLIQAIMRAKETDVHIGTATFNPSLASRSPVSELSQEE